MLMQIRDDVVPNVECLTDQHFQFNQTRRIMHLLLMYTRKEYPIQLVHVGHSKGAMIFIVSTCKKGHFTVNTKDNALFSFASCMCNHDSCIGSSKLSSRGPSLSTKSDISRTSLLR